MVVSVAMPTQRARAVLIRETTSVSANPVSMETVLAKMDAGVRFILSFDIVVNFSICETGETQIHRPTHVRQRRAWIFLNLSVIILFQSERV